MMTPPTEKSLRVRMGVVYVAFFAFLVAVGVRLAQLQVFPHPDLKSLAARQLHRTGKNAPYRLPIFDRNGEELAISVPANSVFARPKLVRHPKRTARLLSGMLGGSAAKWLKKLKSPRPFVWLDRQVTPETAKKIAARGLSGIFIEAENKRVYPNGNLAAHILGFTDIDGAGLAGIELRLNDRLLQPDLGNGTLLRDGRGKPSYVGRKVLAEVEEKKGIYLTIDRRLQNLLEEELERSMGETNAQAAMGIILHPTTGEVLAMAQRPTFDPNYANRFPPEALANRMIGHLLEPGSTLKVLFAAQAIELGLLKSDSLINCEKGKFRIADKTFSEAHNHGFTSLTLEKVLRFSSNIGALKVSHLLGAERVSATLDKFGITSKTGIDLPGETYSGPRPDKFWTPIHLATAGFGQGISSTPLQLVASFLPFANGGYWMRPKLLMELEGEPSKPVLKRILSPKTAAAVRDMLVTVTEEGGTGTRARVAGMRVAGKTGTAQKYDREEGYQGGKYYSSFVGFLPADRPDLVIGVMLDEPGKEFYASTIAAPLFKRVAERALPLLKGHPGQAATSFGEFARTAPTPSVASPVDGQEDWTMPDLKGVSLREALRLMAPRSEKVRISGAGYLTEQEPAPGSSVTSSTLVRLHFASIQRD
jgi:cell division protein FtsI (penicillin-binding protein 3)